MAIRVRRVAVSSDQRCPLCRGDLAGTPAAELAVCAGCDAVHHDACVAELAGGRCGTLGCGRGLAEAQTPVKEEVKGGERSLVLTELKAFAASHGVGGAVRGGAPAPVARALVNRLHEARPDWPVQLVPRVGHLGCVATDALREAIVAHVQRCAVH